MPLIPNTLLLLSQLLEQVRRGQHAVMEIIQIQLLIGGVGVLVGQGDQLASACGVENRLLLLDCRSLEWKAVPLPDHVSIVSADTTVRRKLTSGEYNKRRSACEEALRILQLELPNIKSLRDVSVEGGPRPFDE